MRLVTTLLISLSCLATLAAQTTPRRTAPAATTTLSISVTDGKGAPVGGVTVSVSGAVTREGETDANGSLRLQGLRSGNYRFRFSRKGFVTLERELVIPPRTPSLDQNVVLTAAPPEPPPPPPAPDPPKSAGLPPPGKAMTLDVPDFIEKNYIGNNQPQKVSPVGCSGLAQTSVWQIREAWENRQHGDADAMLYVIGGEGTLKLDGRDVPLAAGSFAVVPRGSSYSVTRKGRNPLFVLATLAGQPCS